MDANKLLNEAMKKEARKAISDYVKSEVHSVAYDEARKIVSAWMKENRSRLEDAVNTEMEKKFKALVKQGVDGVVRSLRWD